VRLGEHRELRQAPASPGFLLVVTSRVLETFGFEGESQPIS
jgi:hypothetical protein